MSKKADRPVFGGIFIAIPLRLRGGVCLGTMIGPVYVVSLDVNPIATHTHHAAITELRGAGRAALENGIVSSLAGITFGGVYIHGQELRVCLFVHGNWFGSL